MKRTAGKEPGKTMDKQTAFIHYLGQDPAIYRAAGPVTIERIMQDLEANTGASGRASVAYPSSVRSCATMQRRRRLPGGD
jgi:hypothetical protein